MPLRLHMMWVCSLFKLSHNSVSQLFDCPNFDLKSLTTYFGSPRAVVLVVCVRLFFLLPELLQKRVRAVIPTHMSQCLSFLWPHFVLNKIAVVVNFTQADLRCMKFDPEPWKAKGAGKQWPAALEVIHLAQLFRNCPCVKVHFCSLLTPPSLSC